MSILRHSGNDRDKWNKDAEGYGCYVDAFVFDPIGYLKRSRMEWESDLPKKNRYITEPEYSKLKETVIVDNTCNNNNARDLGYLSCSDYAILPVMMQNGVASFRLTNKSSEVQYNVLLSV